MLRLQELAHQRWSRHSVSALMSVTSTALKIARVWLGFTLLIAALELCAWLSRCTQFPESRLFVFNPSPGFNCIVTALKSRTLALKTRTKFLPKFVRDTSTKMTLSSFRALVSVRDLSTSSSVNSGI
jgi:hypothetical protein